MALDSNLFESSEPDRSLLRDDAAMSILVHGLNLESDQHTRLTGAQRDINDSKLSALGFAKLNFFDSSLVNDSSKIRSEGVEIASRPVDSFVNVEARPQWYSLGHREPPDGPRIVMTGPVSDVPTGWAQVIGDLSTSDSRWSFRTAENLHSAIDQIIQRANENGAFAEVVFRTHGYSNTIVIGDKDYSLSDPNVLREFSRLAQSGALKAGALIEFQGCNVASGVDKPYSDAREGLQAIANATGVAVEGSPNQQAANRFGWTGQVVRFSPQR